jgi:hypothetical protein
LNQHPASNANLMKDPGMIMGKPTILKAILFAFEFLVAVAMLSGIRSAIEDGEITNYPEVLRDIMFYMFSAAVCFQFCRMIGLGKNDWPNRFMMLGISYIPIGAIMGIIAGIF